MGEMVTGHDFISASGQAQGPLSLLPHRYSELFPLIYCYLT
uniref:Uncharacterized protein n=1 Tax=Arundo donax TaxID=35708 RepID=A0A0A9GQ26_ARUDO